MQRSEAAGTRNQAAYTVEENMMGLIREAVGYESKHIKAVEKADGGQLGISLWFLKQI